MMRPAYFLEESRLNISLLDSAKERIPCIPVLINVISKRVRQLNSGFRPYVKPKSVNEETVDIALREIAEGKLVAEIEFTAMDGS
jgi:DNA-directed RNA polymerase subunit omega